jgi:LmbE family N-acetylglucosaminyl deacetylase
MKYTLEQVKELGTLLGIWAHPDDEAFSMAGLMSYARRNGQRVIIVTATLGDAGQTADEQRWPKAELARIREQELRDSLAISGVDNLQILGYADGTLKDQDVEQAVTRLSEIIRRENPDTIISFYQDGITGHEDHKAVHEWAKQARIKSGSKARLLCVVECHESYEEHGRASHEKFNVYFNVDSPATYKKELVDVCVELDQVAQNDKEQALRAHASQTAHMFADNQDRQALLKSTCDCECFLFVS